MGNIFSISLELESLVSDCWNWITVPVTYICKLEDNFDALKAELENLTDLKDNVKGRVRVAEQQLMVPMPQVKRWISRVETTEVEINKVIKDGAQEIEKLCIGGCCSKNCISSYIFGKKVTQKLEYVASLKSGGVFDVVADTFPSSPVDLRPSEPTVGMEFLFDKVCRCLRQEKVGIVGLFGPEGVGKTTLLTQINNQFRKNRDTPCEFDFVFWVLVSKDLNLQMIQHAIGEKIGFRDDSWKEKSQNEKAIDIHKILSKKRFVLLLDDIWECVDLHDVGVPPPNGTNNCKLVFTTPLEEVCGLMGAHETIEVECLPWEQAWELFQKKVGDVALGRHPNIPKLAQIVAKECGGLPLTLINIGRAMASKFKTEEWDCAINILKNSASTFPDIRFSTMEFSVMVGTFGGRDGTIGGQGGDKWDDGIYDGIRHIIIFHGYVIDSIQVEYAKDGGSVLCEKRGGTGGHKTDKVELDFPNEYLTLVFGYYSSDNEMKIIHSLKFMSNKRIFGPFGIYQEGNKFIIPASNGKIVGLFGRSGRYLDAIGAHVQPF